MKAAVTRESVAIALIGSLIMGLVGGCNESNSKSNMRLSPIYQSAILGAIVGGIVGHQSDEPGEGAAIGAVVFGVGTLLSELDNQHKPKERKECCPETVVVEIHNDNGSVTPVKFKKDGDKYIGPKGERYEQLPTEEQLKPIYGLK